MAEAIASCSSAPAPNHAEGLGLLLVCCTRSASPRTQCCMGAADALLRGCCMWQRESRLQRPAHKRGGRHLPTEWRYLLLLSGLDCLIWHASNLPNELFCLAMCRSFRMRPTSGEFRLKKAPVVKRVQAFIAVTSHATHFVQMTDSLTCDRQEVATGFPARLSRSVAFVVHASKLCMEVCRR